MIRKILTTVLCVLLVMALPLSRWPPPNIRYPSSPATRWPLWMP